MSAANAAAKKRRAPPENLVKTPTVQPTNQSTSPVGLTLPQVISVIDKRLTNLETFVQESKSTLITQNIQRSSSIFTDEDKSEYDNRFNLLAEEIANIKNTIMGLQSYTMSVTKTFMEDKSANLLVEDCQTDDDTQVSFVLSESNL